MADKAASVLAKLKTKAKTSGISYQQCLHFYDIYYLARTFDFDGAKLQRAIFETLQRRGTPYDRDSFKRFLPLVSRLI